MGGGDVLGKIKGVRSKSKLNIDEQVTYLKEKGITFEHVTEDEAKNYLYENSYYYKVNAYRKNFTKNRNNLYQNVDFATLKDLAIIDMHLRYLILKLSLDIEHAVKTKLINIITESDEDGYTIVREYNDYQYQKTPESKRKDFVPSDQWILGGSKFGYHKDLYEKHKDNPSIWVLIEIMSYGQLSSFLGFYKKKKKYGSRQIKLASELMHFSKNVRDNAAHNRPLILNITSPLQFKRGKKPKKVKNPKLQIRQYLYSAGIQKTLVDKYTTNWKVNDLIALLYLHDLYINGGKGRQHRKKEMVEFYKRANRDKQYYQNSEQLGEVLYIFGRLIFNYKS